MAIPDDKIDEIRSAADIVDIVSDYVRLKKSGSNFVGLCPFHNENTPSFTVDPDEGLYHCFGCKAGGDVFTFVQEIEGMGFMEGVQMLAERTGIQLPDASGDHEGPIAGEREKLYSVLRFAARFFHRQLTTTARGKQVALTYLKDRGYDTSIIRTFGLGYAPDSWDALLSAAQEKQYNIDVMEEAGLIIPRKKKEGHYDRFRDRIIFPLFSHVGKVVGFAGRLLEQESDQPKYINSPETPVYDKSRILYGLYQGKKEIRREEEVLLVEGYTDVLSLHQAGLEHAVATSGTALTGGQIDMLSRYADRIVLLYDADEAGIRAANRGIDLILERGSVPHIVPLPPGSDPDSYVREEGSESFRAFLDERRMDFVEFKIAQAEESGYLEKPEGETETKRSIVQSISKIDDPLLQDSFVKRTRDLLEVPDTMLYRAIEREEQNRRDRSSRRRRPRSSDEKESAPRSSRNRNRGDGSSSTSREPFPAEKLLLRLMLQHEDAIVELVLNNMALQEFTAGPARETVEHITELYEKGTLSKTPFVEGSFGSEVQNLAAEVLADKYETSQNWEKKGIQVPRYNENVEQSAIDAMRRLKLIRIRKAIDELDQRIYQAGQQQADVFPLMQEKKKLERYRRKIQSLEFLDE